MSVMISSSFYAKLDPEKVKKAMKKATDEVLLDLYDGCVASSPYRTGKLQESHSYQSSQEGYTCKGVLKNGAKYWSYVEFGTSKMSPRKWVSGTMRRTDSIGTFQRSFKAHYKPQ